MKIHFIGSNGISMRRLMEISEALGHKVSGSDLTTGGHDGKNVIGAHTCVYSSAVDGDNVELIEAMRRSIPTLSRSQFLGELAATYRKTVAVAGTHGKTTTTAMLAAIFAGTPHTSHIGGSVYQRTDGDIFITEACEYQRSFLSLSPDIAVLTNRDYDHPDCYVSEADYASAFEQFAAKSKMLIINGDDERLRAIKHGNVITFGYRPYNDFIATPYSNGFSLYYHGVYLGEITLAVMGEYNVYNALAATAAATLMGKSVSEIAAALAKFTGVARRMELLGELSGRKIISDYAHHPNEIRQALTVRNAKLVLFQPHTYSRTLAFMDDFVSALSYAKKVALLPVYAAREKGDDSVIKSLYHRLSRQTTTVLCTCNELEKTILSATEEGDSVLALGAGDMDEWLRNLVSSRQAPTE